MAAGFYGWDLLHGGERSNGGSKFIEMEMKKISEFREQRPALPLYC